MFIRLRGHTCAACIGADEGHYKRHQELIERLRSIYDTCGVDWPVIPSDSLERGRPRTQGLGVPFFPFSNNPASKKARKDNKRIVRAASRPRVVTQEEITYLDSILHLGNTKDDGDAPDNIEEVNEIERNLRYNAETYNRGIKRPCLLVSMRFPDAGVVFNAEVERILGALRIAELRGRNPRNHGLQGRDLKGFENLVSEFKARVVEDLILVKKEEMEVRMRKAAYLRYTHSASHGVVEDRYSDKDRKTGLKLSDAFTASVSSDCTVPCGEGNEDKPGKKHKPAVSRAAPNTNEVDNRHLFLGHRRVGSGGKLEEVTILRNPAQRPKSPQVVLQRPQHLKLVPGQPNFDTKSQGSSLQPAHQVIIRSPRSLKHFHGHLRSFSAPLFNPDGFEVVGQVPAPLTLPARLGAITTSGQVAGSHPATASRQDLGYESTPSAVATAQNVHSILSKFSNHGNANNMTTRMDVSQTNSQQLSIEEAKRMKKHKCETESKARRAAGRGATSEEYLQENVLGDVPGKYAPSLSSDPPAALEILPTVEVGKHDRKSSGTYASTVMNNKVIHGDPPPVSVVKAQPTSVDSIPKVDSPQNDVEKPKATPTVEDSVRWLQKPSRHSDWQEYSRFLEVDAPSHIIWLGADVSDASDITDACPFCTTNKPDCPFHLPCTYCEGSISHLCYVIYPSHTPIITGPFPRLYCKNLLAWYETSPRTKGKLMVIDEEIKDWVIKGVFDIDDFDMLQLVSGSSRFSCQYRNYLVGNVEGPLIKQLRKVFNLMKKNDGLEHDEVLKRTELNELHKSFKTEDDKVQERCYCGRAVDENSGDVVSCAKRGCPFQRFHRECVMGLGVDKVTKWYCTRCSAAMRDVACGLLAELDG